MPFCSNCGAKINDEKFCPSCGTPVGADKTEEKKAEATKTQENLSAKLAELNNTADTTSEFDKSDIESNRLMAILAYIIFLIPLILAKDSPYAKYHTNQGIVLFLVGLCSLVIGVIPLIGWILSPIFSIIITVLAVIGIVNAATGKAKELPIIGKYKIFK